MKKLKIYEMVNENAVFEKYTDFDLSIAKKASNYNLCLIGGTAIDLYCNYYGISSWRKRSNNDLDFWCSGNNRSSADTFIKELGDEFEMDGFTDDYMISCKLLGGKIDVDVLIDYDYDNSRFMTEVNGFKVMSPIYLFSSKFNRYVNSTDTERRSRDYKDLQILLQVMERRNEFDDLEQYLSQQDYGEKEERELNNIIASLM